MALGGLLYNSDILKSLYEDYQPGFRNNLKNSGHYWYKQFKSKQSTQKVNGKYAVFALEYGIQGGAGAIGDLDNYKTPRTSDIANQTVYIKNLVTVGGIGSKAIYASKDGGAFENLLQAEMKRIYLAAKDDVARGVVTPESDVIATIGTLVGSADHSGGLTIDVGNTHRFQVGLMIDILDADASFVALADNWVITSYNKSGGTITIAPTTATTKTTTFALAVGDVVVNNGAYGKGITGLEQAFDHSTAATNVYHGIARGDGSNTINGWYLPQLYDNSTTNELSETEMRIMTDDAEIEAESQVDNYVARHEVVRGYENDLQQWKQYSNTPANGPDGAMNLAGGYKYLTFDGRPFWKDRMMTENTCYGLNTSTWFEEMHTDWTFDDMDGNIFKFTPAQKYEFRMLKYTNISTEAPRANFKIYGVKEA